MVDSLTSFRTNLLPTAYVMFAKRNNHRSQRYYDERKHARTSPRGDHFVLLVQLYIQMTIKRVRALNLLYQFACRVPRLQQLFNTDTVVRREASETARDWRGELPFNRIRLWRKFEKRFKDNEVECRLHRKRNFSMFPLVGTRPWPFQ